MIGSIEGPTGAPAYRGIALAVFENLQLAQFGNRIPVMTFEVVADDEPQSVGSILTDASAGVISGDTTEDVRGFAAYGRSIKDAVEPLVDCFGVKLFDDGDKLRSPNLVAPAFIGDDQLGNSADDQRAARVEREQARGRDLPSRLSVAYYDEARDYQAGEAQAVAGEQQGRTSRYDLPAVLDADAAKSIAHKLIARLWSQRDLLTLRLPPSMTTLQPGDRLDFALSPPQWCVEKTTVDGFVMVAELHPAIADSVPVPADAGRIVANPDVIAEPLLLEILDVPAVFGAASNEPTLLIATSSASGWQRRPIAIGFGGQSIAVQPARAQSILGRAEGILASAAIDLIDDKNSIVVALIDENQWLTSCDDEALAAGENLAAIGAELVQFGSVLPLGGGRFQLSRLLRGRGGTEWACASHAIDDGFCLIKPGTVQQVALPSWAVAAAVSADTEGGTVATITFLGENVRPPAPVNLAAVRLNNGDLVLSWTRRSRKGFAWVDGIDAPLGEANEQYRVTLGGISGALELSVAETSSRISAGDIAVLGEGELTIKVQQIGDVAASRPAELKLS